jgi:hypothetical protein
VKSLLAELLPHAPHLGLFAVPNIPEDRLRGALRDYAPMMAAEDVLALYDATLLGNGKDGAVFAADRFVFQNNNLEAAQEVWYRDLVGVEAKRKLLGGRVVQVEVNRGRATFTLGIDFSGKPEAAGYVARFLHEAMVHGAAGEMDTEAPPAPAAPATDVAAVRAALDGLRRQGLLTEEDFQRLLEALQAR